MYKKFGLIVDGNTEKVKSIWMNWLRGFNEKEGLEISTNSESAWQYATDLGINCFLYSKEAEIRESSEHIVFIHSGTEQRHFPSNYSRSLELVNERGAYFWIDNFVKV